MGGSAAGHVQQLDTHLYDCAAKFLSVPGGIYVLVAKQTSTAASPAAVDNDDDAAAEYVPLLNNCLQLLPGFRIVPRTGAGGGSGGGAAGDGGRKAGKADSRRRSQSPPPGAKSTRSKQAKDRASGRKAGGDKK